MALKIVLLALLVYCASEVQSQGDDTSLPLSYNATEIQGDGATCPNEQLRQEVQENITTDVRTQIHTILPLVQPSTMPQCPCLSGGSTRIAYFDMTDPNQQCPSEWVLIEAPRRSCGRTLRHSSGSCDSANFPANGISYGRVCGRVTAYQYCSTDGFAYPDATIDDIYIDGVSITHGSPRQHVWTFVAASDERLNSNSCPCNSNPHPANAAVQSFVGNDYFCDTGYTINPFGSCDISNNFANDYPLWDGGGCGPTGGCCENNNPPWFCTTLPQPTTDDIEVRICTDSSVGDEDITIELLEIYVS